MKSLIIILLLFLYDFASDKLPKEFSDLLTRSKLSFTMPEGFKETECIKNRQMNYEYALKHAGKNFEVRYAIRPMDSAIVEYERAVKKGDMMLHPNKWGQSAFQATLLNIGLGGPSSGQMPKVTYFNPEAVKKEFNADWGATASVDPGKEFGGTTYKYCIAVIIHKDNVGDAYFFYVSDNKEELPALMEKAFHSLKFK